MFIKKQNLLYLALLLLFFIIYYLLDISLIIISSLRIQYTIEVKVKWNNSQLLYICIFDSWFDGVMICTHRVYGHSTTKLLFFNGLQHCIVTSVRSVHYFYQFTWKQKILRLCWATTCISDRSFPRIKVLIFFPLINSYLAILYLGFSDWILTYSGYFSWTFLYSFAASFWILPKSISFDASVYLYVKWFLIFVYNI